MPQKSSEARKAYMAEYLARNREKLLADKKRHYQENAEKYRAKARAYREKDVEAYLENPPARILALA